MKIIVATAMKEELAPFRNKYQTELLLKRGKTVIERVTYPSEEGLIFNGNWHRQSQCRSRSKSCL
jgi:hypothetical protein